MIIFWQPHLLILCPGRLEVLWLGLLDYAGEQLFKNYSQPKRKSRGKLPREIDSLFTAKLMTFFLNVKLSGMALKTKVQDGSARTWDDVCPGILKLLRLITKDRYETKAAQICGCFVPSSPLFQ